ncbi:MAG: hypothetical protein AB1458_15035 [Bacteroidota bacterium]
MKKPDKKSSISKIKHELYVKPLSKEEQKHRKLMEKLEREAYERLKKSQSK